QAEDGIRYATVTGVHTCALPISIEDLDAGIQGVGNIEPAARETELGGSIEFPCPFSAPAKPEDVAAPQVRYDNLIFQGVGYIEKIGRASCREGEYMASSTLLGAG